LNQHFVRIYRAADRIEGHLLKGLLEQHGINVRLLGDSLTSGVGELPADVVQVVLEVPSQFGALARELIDDYENRGRLPAAERPSWYCSACAEENPDSFAVCWSCRAFRPSPGQPSDGTGKC